MKSFIKKNIRFIIIVVICITCSVLTTFATDYLFNSSEVYYNNTTSGIQADKVQGAIDELYACASNYAAYNQRLTSAESTIGSGSLTTTSQNLIGAVNEVNLKIRKKNFNVSATNATTFVNGACNNDYSIGTLVYGTWTWPGHDAGSYMIIKVSNTSAYGIVGFGTNVYFIRGTDWIQI